MSKKRQANMTRSSITAGELGSSVSTLESNLKNVLDVSERCRMTWPEDTNRMPQLATYWRAVLLIDEVGSSPMMSMTQNLL